MAGLALVSCPFLGACMAACPTLPNLCWGRGRSAAPLKPDMPHTHKYSCWACPGENTYRELAPVNMHWPGCKWVLPELQGCRRWFGREGVSVLRGDITGARRCQSSAPWHPDPALAFEEVCLLLGSARGKCTQAKPAVPGGRCRALAALLGLPRLHRHRANKHLTRTGHIQDPFGIFALAGLILVCYGRLNILLIPVYWFTRLSECRCSHHTLAVAVGVFC